MPLERLHQRQELLEDYAELLPPIPHDERRRVRGEQDIIVRYEAERALATLPQLAGDAAGRKRLLTLIDRLLADKRLQKTKATPAQARMLERVRGQLMRSDAPSAG